MGPSRSRSRSRRRKLHEELVRIKREVQQETMGFDNVRFYGGIYYLVSAQTLR
jgi:hypothetical protein